MDKITQTLRFANSIGLFFRQRWL